MVGSSLLRTSLKMTHITCLKTSIIYDYSFNNDLVGSSLSVKFQGGTHILMLYTCTTKEMRIKIVFKTQQDLQEWQLGVKKCLFSRKGVLFELY